MSSAPCIAARTFHVINSVENTLSSRESSLVRVASQRAPHVQRRGSCVTAMPGPHEVSSALTSMDGILGGGETYRGWWGEAEAFDLYLSSTDISPSKSFPLISQQVVIFASNPIIGPYFSP